MGAQWKHAGRIENSSKRGALISKLVKEIMVAAKNGDPLPENNARLRAAVEAAKKASVPRENIERAVKKGAGLLDGQVQFELVTYEGFTPHQVAVMVECLTDNKNRTAADLRLLFRKGSLGSLGSVAWMFERLGVVEMVTAAGAGASFDVEEVAIEVGAQAVELLQAFELGGGQTGARFFCDPSDLETVSQQLTQRYGQVILSELSYQAKNKLELAEEQKNEVIDFLNTLDEHDDVHRVYAALKT